MSCEYRFSALYADVLDMEGLISSPSVGWLLAGTPKYPTNPGWGGSFVRAWERPYVRFNRLTTVEDHIEVFGILELAIPLGDNVPENPEARIDVENQTLVGQVSGDGTMDFYFCPKAAKTYTFRIQSNIPALNGKAGGIKSFHPTPDVAQRPSSALSHWWTDDSVPGLAEGEHRGARSVNQWREAYLTDFAERMNWCLPPKLK